MVLYVATIGKNEAYKYQGPKNNKNKKKILGPPSSEFCLSEIKSLKLNFVTWLHKIYN